MGCTGRRYTGWSTGYYFASRTPSAETGGWSFSSLNYRYLAAFGTGLRFRKSCGNGEWCIRSPCAAFGRRIRRSRWYRIRSPLTQPLYAYGACATTRIFSRAR